MEEILIEVLKPPLSVAEIPVCARRYFGWKEQPIALDVHIAVGTVRAHTGNIVRKFDLTDASQIPSFVAAKIWERYRSADWHDRDD